VTGPELIQRKSQLSFSSQQREREYGQAQERESARFGNEDHTEQAVGLAIGARGKVDCLRTPAIAGATTWDEPPKAVDHQWIAVRSKQLREEAIGREVENVDGPVAEVANQEVARIGAESRRRERQAPR